MFSDYNKNQQQKDTYWRLHSTILNDMCLKKEFSREIKKILWAK